MKILRSIIADDEPLARERLKRLLANEACDVLAEFEDGKSLLEWLNTHPPVDVAFMDIQMPGLNGLEVLAELQDPPPVVFVTAHPAFAAQTYEFPAMDFLVKPVFAERLAKTLERARNHQIPKMIWTELRTKSIPCPRVAIKAGEGIVYIELTKLTHFEFRSGGVLAFRGSTSYPTRWMHLTEVEQAFPEAGLMRIHRNLLLRPESVIGSRRALGGRIKVTVAEGVELTASLGMTSQLKARLANG